QPQHRQELVSLRDTDGSNHEEATSTPGARVGLPRRSCKEGSETNDQSYLQERLHI
ncbi:hypothetical protein P7K49_025063, partial [Saguinus oedipus]